MQPATLGPVTATATWTITAETLYPRWERFFKPDDIIVTETGTSSMGLAFAHLPEGASSTTRRCGDRSGGPLPPRSGRPSPTWTPAMILMTGEGSHQLTAQEISQFGRRGLQPIVFVLNNNGYLIERLLCKNGPTAATTTSRHGGYTALPHALGCDDWHTARVSTLAELDQAMKAAERATPAATSR